MGLAQEYLLLGTPRPDARHFRRRQGGKPEAKTLLAWHPVINYQC